MKRVSTSMAGGPFRKRPQPVVKFVFAKSPRGYLIQMSPQKVIGHVAPNVLRGVSSADDVFVITPLPEGNAGSLVGFVDLFCCGGFTRTE